jgi:3-deoxy-manno-octulosonate cytidylyltransferase (CMP-KDO synthetase)
MQKIASREQIAQIVASHKAAGVRVVFTNGCFDILHVGHVDLLEKARGLGDFLVVGLNSDASVQRLKGPKRPIHDQGARARVMAALQCVDAVVIFEEDTPIETIRALKPSIHVKGGDYQPKDLPEASTVHEGGGEIRIVPLVEGYSTTRALEKGAQAETDKGETASVSPQSAVIVIPVRFGSTRFPGKPLVKLGDQTVISRVVRAALQTSASRPVLVATDDERISAEIQAQFSEEDAVAVMTSSQCHTGTDRLAEAVRARFGELKSRVVVVNVQGDEPFIEPQHVDVLIGMMQGDATLQMATLATPITEESSKNDPNVVKVALSERGRALYFSRSAIPYDRDGQNNPLLRHLGIYAYDARWLLQMAALPPSKLEEIEKLEQLRALESGGEIGVTIVEGVVPVAIDTPEDLVRAEAYLSSRG